MATFGRVGVSAGWNLIASAGALAILAIAPWASAQSRTVAPINDGVLLRSGNSSSWYEIASLKSGQVLKADSEVYGWLRVEYPAGLNAVVKNDEVEVKGDEATITRRTRLRALSMLNPVLDESFRFVCEQELLPGTKLKVVSRIKDRKGTEAGYIVQAPDCARGFVLARDVRDVKPDAPVTTPASAPATTPPAAKPTAATTTESKPATPAPTTPAPMTPAPTTAAPAPAPTTSTPAPVPSGTNAAPTSTGDTTNPASTSSVAQPGSAAPSTTPPSTTPAQPTTGSTTPPADGSQPAPADPAQTTPADAAPATEALVPVEPAKPAGPTIRQLDRMLEDFLSKPVSEAGDPQELIEQYTTYANEAESKPGGSRLVQLADQRLAVLRLRQQAFNLLPEIAALEDRSRNALQNYQLTIDRLIANRQYLVAGRLLPSTVYDGGRLPLMYRLVSIDPAINRTIAYIVPSAELQLEQKTGAIVGILGDGTIEPSSLVQIIKPTVVDVLRAAADLPPEPVQR